MRRTTKLNILTFETRSLIMEFSLRPTCLKVIKIPAIYIDKSYRAISPPFSMVTHMCRHQNCDFRGYNNEKGQKMAYMFTRKIFFGYPHIHELCRVMRSTQSKKQPKTIFLCCATLCTNSVFIRKRSFLYIYIYICVTQITHMFASLLNFS